MSNITLTIPNDDHIALRAFGKALEEMALAHGAEPVGEMTYKIDVNAALERLNAATGELMQAAPRMMQELRCEGDELQGKRKEPEVDTTAQQVESLCHRQVKTPDFGTYPGKEIPVEANGATYETDLGSDNPHPVPVADSTGTPWDERIHSASKALNADGSWRLRRKPKDMDEAEWATLVESVKNELMGVDAEDLKEFEESKLATLESSVEILKRLDEDKLSDPESDTGALVGTVEPPVTPPGDDFHTDAGVVAEQTVAGIPPIPVPPPVALPGSTGATDLLPPAPIPTAVPTLVDWTFPKLMTFLTERQGKIDVATVNMLLAQDGIASLPELNAHPDKIGPFVARVKAHLGG